MKVVLEYIKNEDKTGSKGKPYTSTSIKIRGKFYNGFGDEYTKLWKVGQTVEVDLWEEEYNGKMQSKFIRMEADEMENKVNNLLNRVANLEKFLKKHFVNKLPTDQVITPENKPSLSEQAAEVFPGPVEAIKDEPKQTTEGEPW